MARIGRVQRLRTPDAAGCVITGEADRILLVRHTYGAKKWTLPGGQKEPHESPWEAAVRKCREELGIELQAATLTGIYFLPHRDAYVFIYRVKAFTGTPKADGAKVEDWRYFALDSLPAAMSSFTIERIKDALAFAGSVRERAHLVDQYTIGEAY